MRKRISRLASYIPAVFAAVVLYHWFRTAPDSALRVMLLPHAGLTEIFYNTPLSYVEGIGYVSAGGGFAIGRECLGGNLILMLFLMSAFMFGRFFSGFRIAGWHTACLLGAVIIGVLISSARIIVSLLFVGHPRFALLHTGIGMIMYFFALTACYALLNIFFRGERIETDF